MLSKHTHSGANKYLNGSVQKVSLLETARPAITHQCEVHSDATCLARVRCQGLVVVKVELHQSECKCGTYSVSAQQRIGGDCRRQIYSCDKQWPEFRAWADTAGGRREELFEVMACSWKHTSIINSDLKPTLQNATKLVAKSTRAPEKQKLINNISVNSAAITSHVGNILH